MTLRSSFVYFSSFMVFYTIKNDMILITETEDLRCILTSYTLVWSYKTQFNSVQFSHSIVFDSLRPHESQHARPPCPSPTPRVHSDSCTLSRWCHPAISSSVVAFSFCSQSLPASVFSNESTLPMRWPKYWSFSFTIIPSKESPGLISFRMDWLELLPV